VQTTVLPRIADVGSQLDKLGKLDEAVFLDWLLRYYIIPETTEPYSFVDHAYLLDIAKETSPEICVQKSAQCAISEILVALSLFLAEMGFRVIYAFPAQQQMDKFSHARVQPAIMMSDHIRAAVSGVTNAGQKMIRDGIVYFNGSQNYRQIISVAADAVFIDELDGHKQENVPRLTARLGHSLLKWKRLVSTPTYTEYGINEQYLESDQREWHLKCEHCGEQQPLDWWVNVIEKPTVMVVCRKCRKPINRMAFGEWVAKHPGRSIPGYHINKLMCGRTDLVAMHKRSKSKRYEQAFYNDDLGLPFTPEGSKLTRDDIAAIATLPDSKPEKGWHVTAGVDVGPKTFYVRISRRMPNGRRQAISAEQTDSWENLERLFNRWNVKDAVIDAQPEQRAAKKFCENMAKNRRRVWRCYFHDITDEYVRVPSEHRIKANRTMVCDSMFAAYVSGEDLLLPRSFLALDAYTRHMQAPTRILLDPNKEGVAVAREGRPMRAVWLKTHNDDHFFFAEVYDWMAADMARGAARTVPGRLW
jgi:hypothetical protein